MHLKCPTCNRTIPDKLVASAAAAMASAKRQTFTPGPGRNPKPTHCPGCGLLMPSYKEAFAHCRKKRTPTTPAA